MLQLQYEMESKVQQHEAKQALSIEKCCTSKQHINATI